VTSPIQKEARRKDLVFANFFLNKLVKCSAMKAWLAKCWADFKKPPRPAVEPIVVRGRLHSLRDGARLGISALARLVAVDLYVHRNGMHVHGRRFAGVR
jgi:hypothetical protein